MSMAIDSSATILALPMHGESKLRREGLRTRDGHVLEWISRLHPTTRVLVHSRPEPWPRVTVSRRLGESLPASWQCISPEPIAIPPLRDRRRWWIKSNRYAVHWPPGIDAAIVWNPVAQRPAKPYGCRIVVDLLDDWLIHPSFASIRAEVERGYSEWFHMADAVTANSEGTLALAHSFGRTDAELVLNGCDPDRFTTDHRPSERFTVGYGGKLSERLDVGLIQECARLLPEAIFEFVGPTMSRDIRRALRQLPNVRCVGDLPYPRYPSAFIGWDVAWAPHRLGEGEVGGDLIKLYEYRAAGLPTFTTRVIGWKRVLPGVRALPREEIPEALQALFLGGPGSVPREPIVVPPESTWRAKTEHIIECLRV